MREIIVNGKFLSQNITGVQRFSLEVLRHLSQYDDLSVRVAMPCDAVIPRGEFKNCIFERVGTTKGVLWEQMSLPKYCKKHKAPLFCFGNIAPVFYRSTVVLHDVISHERENFNSRTWELKYKLIVRSYIYSSKQIFTVSNFSRQRIMHFYPKLKDVKVICNGHEHVAQFVPEQVFGIPEVFYLSVGSNALSKNFQYVLELAKANPNLNFVITGKSGKIYNDFLRENKIENCFFTGYVEDGQLAWLYKNCKGFILPSFYEGFGVPPLEAIAMGCRNIFLSDIPVFREIYDGCATFFDPYNVTDLIDLENPTVCLPENYEAVLKKYTWENAAAILHDYIVNSVEFVNSVE